ncbi:hypothetical protein KIN20_002890 [Parelaphostrongylus tenuis]|uniref:Uncharacterized protein n=1 Tax=Parelaphostrongylus tenuis TaxID=148309 RepID=A0AAD5MHG5_PARTN|nr:hypothetical protein KIN20_002890 [Parelaphostrongylus tenuis]
MARRTRRAQGITMILCAVMPREKDGEVLGEEDWETFEVEELKTKLQGLSVSAHVDTGNELDASMDKNELIVKQTNIYGTQKKADCEDTNVEEIETFLAVCVNECCEAITPEKFMKQPSVF